MIYLIVGYPSSGKTTARKMLQDMLGCDGIEASDYAKKLVKVYKKEKIQEVHNVGGLDVVAKEIIKDIKKKEKLRVVSGLRTIEEVLLFQSLFGCFIIAIACSPSQMKNRMSLRKRSNENWEERFESDKSLGIDKIIQIADQVVDNNSDITSLNLNLKSLIKNYG
jgi:dephospho-CoA kinase